MLPDVTHVQNSPFMLAMDGFSGDPMGALDTIRTALPAKHGSLWFAVGVKFTTYQLIETKAVLFVKISDGFTIGILGMSSLSLPDKQFSVGYVELAFLHIMIQQRTCCGLKHNSLMRPISSAAIAA